MEIYGSHMEIHFDISTTFYSFQLSTPPKRPYFFSAKSQVNLILSLCFLNFSSCKKMVWKTFGFAVFSKPLFLLLRSVSSVFALFYATKFSNMLMQPSFLSLSCVSLSLTVHDTSFIPNSFLQSLKLILFLA